MKDYETRSDWRMRSDIHNAPHGVKLLLINEGGVLIVGKLDKTNLTSFLEWSELPKRAKNGNQ